MTDMIKKKKYIAMILVGVACIAALLYVILTAYQRRSQTIADKIINECKANEETVIDMSDFTDFEWEKCIVYGAKTQTKDIRDSFGIDYDTYLDLNYGIVFVKGDKVVYEGFFKVSEYDLTNKMPPLIIYPYAEDSEDKINYACFAKDEAKFKVVKKDDGNNCGYRLYPVVNGGD